MVIFTIKKSLIHILCSAMKKATLNVYLVIIRGGSRAAATSRMEYFVIIVNG